MIIKKKKTVTKNRHIANIPKEVEHASLWVGGEMFYGPVLQEWYRPGSKKA